MSNVTHPKTLLTGTALALAFSAPVWAQTLNVNVEELAGKSEECRALGMFIADHDGSISTVDPVRVAQAVNNDEPAECVEVQQLLVTAYGADDATVATDADTARADTEAEAEATTESVQTTQDATIVGEAVVSVPEPNVDVRVPQPEVTVRKMAPQVSVTDGAAQIEVEQAQPEIAVEIPTINVRVTMPAPSIYVLQSDPQVSVTEADPMVEVVQGDPEITVTQPDPQLDIDMGLAAADQVPVDQTAGTDNADGAEQVTGDVQIARDQPIVSFVASTDQPQVEITRANPEVSFSGAEPNVTITMAQDPTVEVQMAGEPQITIETPEQRDQRRAGAQQADASAMPMAGAQDQTAGAEGQMSVADVKRLVVVTADGQELGNPQGVVDMDGQQYILLSSGEAMGLGNNVVPYPMANATMDGNRVTLGNMSDEDMQRARDFQYDENAVMADDQPVMMNN